MTVRTSSAFCCDTTAILTLRFWYLAVLNYVQYLLECDKERLKSALLTRENVIKGEKIVVPLNVDQVRSHSELVLSVLGSR